VKSLLHGDVAPERLWYSHDCAVDEAHEIASETGVRQRVKRIPSDSNIFRCTWLIEEI